MYMYTCGNRYVHFTQVNLKWLVSKYSLLMVPLHDVLITLVLCFIADCWFLQIKKHLSGVYKAFTCSEEELEDLDRRLAYADLLENYYEAIKSVQDELGSQNREAFQCQRWNTHGVDGCIPGQNVAPEVFTVQEHVVRPLYSQYCNCEVLEPSPICNIVES